jgi:hypothetical protein
MKEFLIKYKFGILLTLFLLTIGIFVAVNIQSCKNKVKTILTVPGYDSAYHRYFDSLRAADNKHFDSVFSSFDKKFQLYDSTIMNSDIRMEVRRQVYEQMKKYKMNLSNDEIYRQYKEGLKDE